MQGNGNHDSWNQDPKKDFGFRDLVNNLIRNRHTTISQSNSPENSSIVLSRIFENANDTIRILTSSLNGEVSDSIEFVNALKKYLKDGKRLKLLLTEEPNVNSIAYKIISENNPNVEIRFANTEFAPFDKKLSGGYKFTVSDTAMYRYETPGENQPSLFCFNDINMATNLIKAFDSYFDSAILKVLNVQEYYVDNSFKQKCLIIVPDFETINLELIEYFSRRPEELQKLRWRKFEELLDSIFRNQGFRTILGPGSNDKGIDLRLIQKDTIGEMMTIVQAKRYSLNNPIKLEAVQALTAIVDQNKANRGLFVTTSRYLPGVEQWAAEQQTKIELAKSEDVAKWCLDIAKRT